MKSNSYSSIPGKEMRISCIGVSNAVYYFTKEMNVPLEKLLEGLPFDMDFIKNTGNWLDNKQAFRFYLNCQKSVKGFLHTDWKTVGENMQSNEAPGYFKLLFKMLPFNVIYGGMPRYVQSVSKWGEYEVISLKKGEVIYKVESKDKNLRDMYSTGGECHHSIGVINSIPKVKDSFNYFGDAKHEICSMPLHTIAENSYGIGAKDWKYDNTGFYIKGQLVAMRVKLKPRQDNEKYLSKNFEISDEKEANAMVLIKDVFHEGAKIFNEGDIYNAPYCIFDITYKKRFFIGERMNSKQMVIFLEKQLQMTEDKFRQAVWARQEIEENMEEINKRDEIIKSYMRYSILDEVYSGGNPLDFMPTKKSMAIMFADIRNFAAITENMDPMETVTFLNKFFHRMGGIIQENNGEIDKLIGDGIMAVFSECKDAVKAAVEMQKLLSKGDEDFLTGKKLEVKMGVGINFDEVVEGNIGNAGSRLDRTIIGDGVNLASRLESLTKFYSSGIIISDFVRKEIGDSFDMRYLDLINVKGKTHSVAVYEVLDAQNDIDRGFKKKTLQDFQKAVKLYIAGDFPKSLKAFMELNGTLGEYKNKNPRCMDPIIDIYMQRILELMNYINDKSFMLQWDGVYKHTEK